MQLPATRTASIAYYRHAIASVAGSLAQREVERELARNDLFFLLVYVLGRRDLNHDWLFARCREVERQPDGHLDLWAREHGKDLADATPMLTFNRGWTTHGELEIGDQVYAPDGRPVTVLSVSERYHNNDCYRLGFADGGSIVAGAGHLWRVRRKRRQRVGDWRVGARRVDWDEEIIRTADLPNRADIGVIEAPLTGVAAQLPIDPYVLGAWLGDGTRCSPNITSGIDDADEMESILSSRGITVRRRVHSNSVTLVLGSGIRGKRGSSDFRNGLRELGIYREKHIPQVYLRASAHQRMMLLRGLMDTDGCCNNRGTAMFCSAKESLAHEVLELARGLALRPRLRRHVSKDHVSWRVAFQAHRDRNPFCFKRKAERAIAPSAHRYCQDVVYREKVSSVPTRCLQVDGGMYLAGRELIPTHNSSLITFGLTVRDILRDPEITVGIFSFNRPMAKAFLRQIKREFEGNEKLRQLFPDIIWENPHREAPKWAEDDGIIVKRRSNPKESTIEAWGLVDGQPTSRHFRLMVFDDAVTADSVTSPEMIQKVTRAWEAALNLTTEGGAIRYIGTRWHYADPYAEMIRRGAAIERRHPVTIDGTVDGEPVLWSRERVAQKRRDMGPYTFSSQMLLDPAADRTHGFKDDWIRYYQGASDFSGMNKYLLVDAANEKKKYSDYTAMIVVGLASDQNYYILDIVRDRLSLRERGDAVFALHRRWRPLRVGYERYGMMADVEYIRERQAQDNYRFEIIELGGQLPKHDRIRRLVPLFEGGRMHLPETLSKVDFEGRHVDLVRSFLDEEYRPFPVASHEDMLDALSRICDQELNVVWPKGPVPQERYVRKRERSRAASWMAA